MVTSPIRIIDVPPWDRARRPRATLHQESHSWQRSAKCSPSNSRWSSSAPASGPRSSAGSAGATVPGGCSKGAVEAPFEYSQRAADRLGDGPELPHQLGELRRLERLRAVGERLLGPRVHLDDEPVR